MGFIGSKWGKLAVVAGALALMVTSVGAVAAAGPGGRGPGRPSFGGPPGPGGPPVPPGFAEHPGRGVFPGPEGEDSGVSRLSAIVKGLERAFDAEQKLIEQASKSLSPEAQAKLQQALELAKQAWELEKQTLETLAQEEREKFAGIAGSITTLDTAAHKVTIAKRGDDGTTVTVVVTADTKLMKDGKAATFDQLAVDDMAVSVYARESGEARLLNVHTPRPAPGPREGRPGPQRGPGRGGDHRPGGR